MAADPAVSGASLFDVKAGLKMMEGGASALPPQRALPSVADSVVQLGQLRLRLLPDLNRAHGGCQLAWPA
jgi:hypothetical protein